MRREWKQIIFAVFIMFFILSVAPHNLLDTMGIHINGYAATLSNPRIVTDSSMESGQKVTWDCVWFGSYPQTEIVDQASTSGCYGKKWSTSSDYEVDSSLYKSLENATFDSNGDTTIDNTKYRRIMKSDATYGSSGSDSYYNWSSSDAYHYFRYEPIKWRVLTTNGTKAFLLADVALDDQRYNTSSADVTWETSTMRSWLNGYGSSANANGTDYSTRNFIGSAFTSSEKSALVSTALVNDDNIRFGTEGGNNTNDKIFLLSESEVYYTDTAKSYGFLIDMSTDDEARESKSSAFAKAMGIFSSNPGCWWWLRSPGYHTNYAALVYYYGHVDDEGHLVHNYIVGCRPALNLNLSSSNLWSYAGTVCSDGTVTEPTYSVTYDANGGSGAPSSQTKTYGVDLTLSSTVPTRSGYTFVGWGTSSTATSSSYDAGGTYSANEDITLYAVWIVTEYKTYTIKFDANGGSGAPASMSKVGTDINVVMGDLDDTLPVRVGYTFYGWSASSSWSSQRVGFGTTFGCDKAPDGTKATLTIDSWTYAIYCNYTGGSTSSNTLTLYAQWQPTTYTVHYDANGGSGAPSDQTKTYGTDLTISSTVPTRSGWTFAGWGTSSSATNVSYSSSGKYTANASINLYAIWINTITLSYNANNGSGAPSSQSGTMHNTATSCAFTISSTVPTRTGYAFAGWATTNNASSASYDAGDIIVLSVDTTLYAVWETATYSMVYDANGGAGAPAARTGIAYGTNISLSSLTPTRDEYKFLGWSEDKNATSPSYAPSDELTVTKNITFYAVWQKDDSGSTTPTVTTYTINYLANGGSGAPSSQTKTKGTALPLSSTVPTRSGWTFAGWGTSSTDTSADYSAGSNYSNDADITLYAIWKKTITLTYDANGGSGAPSSQSGTIYNAETGYTFTISSSAPTRSGYTFRGWSRDSSAGESSYTAGNSCTLSSSSTLYAVWQSDEPDPSETTTYTVSYDANGGEGAPVSRSGIVSGTTIELSSLIPTRSGYTFKGWSKDKTGSTPGYAAGDQVTITANLLLFAVWKADESSTDPDPVVTYTVRYDANGGSGAPSSQTKTKGSNLTLSSNIPSQSGYSFLGWGTSGTATSVSYSAGSIYSKDADITLYAVWKANPVTPSTTTPSATTPAKQQQVITASSLNVAYKSGPFYLGATTNGNGTLSYSSTNPGVASISSTGLVTVYQYGITQINIAASETANFTAASTAVTITVGPQAVKITKATSKKKKQLVLTWKKNKEATGYQMYISLSPNFDSYTFARACSKKYVKYTFTGLKSKKIYYVKSRSYKKIGGIYYFGPWSVVKAVKVK